MFLAVNILWQVYIIQLLQQSVFILIYGILTSGFFLKCRPNSRQLNYFYFIVFNFVL